jgi:hypothetical protein
MMRRTRRRGGRIWGQRGPGRELRPERGSFTRFRDGAVSCVCRGLSVQVRPRLRPRALC